MIGQAYANLNPGGFMEMLDFTLPVGINDGVWPKDSALLKWYIFPLTPRSCISKMLIEI